MLEPRRIKAVYRFPNGMVAVIGDDDQQMPELQGPYVDCARRIAVRIDKETQLNGISSTEMITLGARLDSE